MTKRKPRIAVFFGGETSTRDLSLETGRWASEYLPRSRYDVIPVHVTANDEWQVPLGSLPVSGSIPRAMEMLQAAVPAQPAAQALPRLMTRKPDVFFTLLRGKGGDDGKISTLAETLGVAAVGSSPLTCITTGNKQTCARAIEAIALSPFAMPVSQTAAAEETVAQLPDELAFPLFVKPAAAEGSTGVSRIERKEDLAAAITAAQAEGDILLQEAQPGTEFSVTVFEDDNGKVRVLPATVVQPVKAPFFDSLAKRRSGRVRLTTPEYADETARRVMQVALDVYEALDCHGVVTVDLIAHPEGIDVLEINTVPVATAHTPLIQQLKAAGLHPSQFVDSIVKSALSF